MSDTFAQDIERVAGGQPIEAIVIGNFGWGEGLDEEAFGFGDERKPIPLMMKRTVLSWQEARYWLDYEYDDGYGAPDCHAIYAWTKSRIIMVHEYDGSTGVFWVRRNPEHCNPVFA